jgi:hypothetical protein
LHRFTKHENHKSKTKEIDRKDITKKNQIPRPKNSPKIILKITHAHNQLADSKHYNLNLF